jgi:DNA-binding MarR family transcriptional regulator
VTGYDDLATFLAATLPALARRLRADPMPGETDDDQETWNEVQALRSTPGQLTALGTLVHRPTLTMQALATRLGVTPATATAVVRRLVAGGYVERRTDQTDWRVVCVAPTDKGRRLYYYYTELRRAAMHRRMMPLSVEQIAALQDAVPALQRLLEDPAPQTGEVFTD